MGKAGIVLMMYFCLTGCSGVPAKATGCPTEGFSSLNPAEYQLAKGIGRVATRNWE